MQPQSNYAPIRQAALAPAALCLFAAGCYLSPSLSISKLFIILIAVLSFIYFLFDVKRLCLLIVNQASLAFLLFITVLSCVWGNPSSSSYALKSTLTTLFFVLFILQFKSEIRLQLDRLLTSITGAAGLLAVILLYTHLSLHGFDLSIKIHKIYGPIIQTIKTASVLTVALLIIIWHIFTHNNWRRWAGVVLFFPILLAMLLLQSRGAVLSLGVGCAVLYFAHQRNSKKNFAKFTITLSILACLISLGAFFFLNYDSRGISDSVRIPIWQTSLKQAYPQDLLWGIGYSKDQSLVAPDGIAYTHSHNIFVSLFRFTGLAGLVLFCSYLYITVKRALNQKSALPETSLFLAWLATALSIFFFNGSYPVYLAPEIFLILWLPLALLWIC